MYTLTSLTIGIQFKKAFRVLDYWGKIVDDILTSPDSGFDPTYLPLMHSQTYDKVLRNAETEDYIRLTAEDLQYCHHLTSKGMSVEVQRAKFFERVNQTLVHTVLDAFNLNIMRIGMVYETQIGDAQYKQFMQRYFAEDMQDISAFRFSKREVTPEALRNKSINNYINKIYTLLDNEKGKILAYDYQEFFIPISPCWFDCKPLEYFEKSWLAYTKDVKTIIGDMDK